MIKVALVLGDNILLYGSGLSKLLQANNDLVEVLYMPTKYIEVGRTLWCGGRDLMWL